MALEPFHGGDAQQAGEQSFRGHVNDQCVQASTYIDPPALTESNLTVPAHPSLRSRWSFGDAPNGGILTSLAITAARQAEGVTHKDPLSVSTHFVRKVGTGMNGC
jgi:hypothetical protein